MTRTSNNKLICPKCLRNITKRDYSISCAGACRKYYHKGCTGLTHAQFSDYEKCKSSKKWVCEVCCSSDDSSLDGLSSDEDTQRKKGTGQKQKQQESSSQDWEVVIAKSNPSNKDIMKFLVEKFKVFEESLNFQSKTIDELKESVNKLHKENKTLRKEKDDMEKRITALEGDLKKINRKLSNEEMEERDRNIIVMGIKTDHTKCKTDIQKLFVKLNVNVGQEEFTTKLLPSRKPEKPILVSLKSKEIRNGILEKRKQCGSVTTDDCGLDERGKRIFINEDLPFDVRALLQKARSLKNKGYKFIWCKHSKVYIRKEENSEVIKINDTNEIDCLLNQ